MNNTASWERIIASVWNVAFSSQKCCVLDLISPACWGVMLRLCVCMYILIYVKNWVLFGRHRLCLLWDFGAWIKAFKNEIGLFRKLFYVWEYMSTAGAGVGEGYRNFASSCTGFSLPSYGYVELTARLPSASSPPHYLINSPSCRARSAVFAVTWHLFTMQTLVSHAHTLHHFNTSVYHYIAFGLSD